jgi:hypothetical protein
MRRRAIFGYRKFWADLRLRGHSKLERAPLKSLHAESSLNSVKLEQFRKLSTEQLLESLNIGQACSLKARADGTLVEGHHRIRVLRERGVDVDSLPREIVPRD